MSGTGATTFTRSCVFPGVALGLRVLDLAVEVPVNKWFCHCVHTFLQPIGLALPNAYISIDCHPHSWLLTSPPSQGLHGGNKMMQATSHCHLGNIRSSTHFTTFKGAIWNLTRYIFILSYHWLFSHAGSHESGYSVMLVVNCVPSIIRKACFCNWSAQIVIRSVWQHDPTEK